MYAKRARLPIRTVLRTQGLLMEAARCLQGEQALWLARFGRLPLGRGRAPWRKWLAACKGFRGANHARREALRLWRGLRGPAREPPDCAAGLWRGHRPRTAANVRFGRGRRPRVAARLRFGRTGRPSCTETGRHRNAFRDRDTPDPPCAKTGRIRDAFFDRDTDSGRKAACRAPCRNRTARFPRSGSPIERKP